MSASDITGGSSNDRLRNRRRAGDPGSPWAGDMEIQRNAQTQEKGTMKNGIGGMIALAFAAVIGIFIVFGSWYTIDQTQRGVLLRNGAFVEVVQPGLHFKWPWIESVYKIDMQTHTHKWDKMESYSADQQPAFLRVSVTLHVSPDKVAEIYSRFGGDMDAAINRLVSPHVPERTKVVFGQYTAARAISARGQLNADASRSLSESLAYDPIFAVDSVQIEDISFSGEYIKSVEQRMQAEVEVLKFRQQLEREKVQAEIVVTQAKATADAVRAAALASADKIRAEAQANAEAIRLRGDAEAQAIQARGDALNKNPNLVALVQAERWDGKLPVTMIPGGSVPMLALGK